MPITNYVNQLTGDQADKLKFALEEEQWEIDEAPYAHFRARKNKTTIVAYESGKLVVQGRGTEDVVQFIIEPRILCEVRMGYEVIHAREENPDMFEPHVGMDESGKGDFFGPMVTACCYTDEATATELFDLGVQDSKNIKSDKRMRELAQLIRDTLRGKFAILRIGNPSYNRMYQRSKNVNKMLAWAHARTLENYLERFPGCPRALVDQFARNESTMTRALMERGRQIIFQQRTKAESDIAVAAASIIARTEFIDLMDKLSEEMGVKLLRGASGKVLELAADLVRKKGPEVLEQCAKTHFRTADMAIRLANGESLESIKADYANRNDGWRK